MLRIKGREAKSPGSPFRDFAPDQRFDQPVGTLFDRFEQRRLNRLTAFDLAAKGPPEQSGAG